MINCRRGSVCGAVLALVVVSTSIATAQPQIPPPIQAMMDKAARGEALTPQELQELEAWAQKIASGGIPASPPKRGSTPKAGRDALLAQGAPDLGGLTPEMFCKPKPAIAATAPTDREYLKLLDRITARYGAKAGGEKATVAKALAKEPLDAAGANLGAALFIQNHHPAAVLATVWSARRQPRDPVFAANLGAILDADGDDKTALQVLLYAAAKHPTFELVQSNLGWVHQAHDNRASAKAAFDRAALTGFPSAHIGLGLLALCNDEWSEAHRQFNLALASRYSSIAEAGVQKAKEKLEEEETKREPDPTKRPPPSPPPPPVRDRFPARLEGLHLVDPPFGASAKVFAANADLGRAYYEQSIKIPSLGTEARQLQARILQKAQTARPPVYSGNKVAVFANQDRHTKAWRDARDRFSTITAYLFDRLRDGHLAVMDDAQRRSAALTTEEELAHRPCGDSAPCHARVRALYCKKFQALGNYVYSAYVPVWSGFWPKWRVAFEELWAQSNSVMAMTTDADWVAYYSVERKLILYTTIGQAGTLLETMRGVVKGLHEHVCPPLVEETTAETMVTPDGKPAPCHWPQQGSVKLELEVVAIDAAGLELSFDCDEAKIELGIGPGRWAVSRDFNTRNVTVFGGVGGGIDAPTAAGLEGKAGWFVTLEGMTPVDGGLTASGSGYLGVVKREYTGKVGIATDAGIDATDFIGGEVHTGVGGVGIWKEIE